MKTEREAKLIDECLVKLVEFFNKLAENTDYLYCYKIKSAKYENSKEMINLIFEDGSELCVNINMDSVPASMKDCFKVIYDSFY